VKAQLQSSELVPFIDSITQLRWVRAEVRGHYLFLWVACGQTIKGFGCWPKTEFHVQILPVVFPSFLWETNTLLNGLGGVNPNASNRVAKAFLQTSNSTQNNQHTHIGTFLYLVQVKAVLFPLMSGTGVHVLPFISFFNFLGIPHSNPHVMVSPSPTILWYTALACTNVQHMAHGLCIQWIDCILW